MATATLTIGQLVQAVYSAQTAGNGPRVSVRLPRNVSSLRFASGTGNLQINELFYKAVSFSGTTPQTFDLTAISDGYRTIAFSKVKLLLLLSQTTSYTDTLTVGNAASNQWTPDWSGSTVTQVITGPSPLLWCHAGAGWTVDGTHKSLKITPSASQTVDFVVAGLA